MPQQRKFFPGWLVVASGFVIMATCYTIGSVRPRLT